jgi:hypothetical protein
VNPELFESQRAKVSARRHSEASRKAHNLRRRVALVVASVVSSTGLLVGGFLGAASAQADPAITVTVGYVTSTRVCNARIGCHYTYTDHNVTITNGSGEGVLCNGWFTIGDGQSLFQSALAHGSTWVCIGQTTSTEYDVVV